ncbi:hypothetical protein OGAPHI_002590 [Ogataea philodendri]|uniref:Nicotinamide-nucleotide adenylyltransferase n=1 Tax=Ogataea philodendri TaxID=1378263 RepID=A0A9P8PBW2_9ASCO|nr:uncharacterized protein OGAPHI_002590 [Ogataea philodendri]KAH3668835.1 hypothetical protein OGAPHI_002590 [Ogataea philodendri]
MSSLTSQLQSILSAGHNSFKLVYTAPANQFILPLTKQILVLDSSFNPPHNGHFSLIAKSMNHSRLDDHSMSHTSINSKSVLLLLSVKNADKGVQPAKFEDRLAMMYKMADHISEQLGVACGVGITNCSLFVDKAKEIQNYLAETQSNNLKLTFLLGYDTLIRLLDPKYYVPQKLGDALGSFFSTNDCFVLTRKNTSLSLEDQLSFVGMIKDGQLADVPATWADKIHVVSGDDKNLNVSSSDIRKLIQANETSWTSNTMPKVAEYITSHHPYQ